MQVMLYIFELFQKCPDKCADVATFIKCWNYDYYFHLAGYLQDLSLCKLSLTTVYYLIMKNISEKAVQETFLSRDLSVLVAILVLAVILRIYLIGNHGLWQDELSSLRFAKFSLMGLIQEVAAIDNHPPTYYIFLHYWIWIFGDSEASLRMPSAVFSVLSVIFTYKVGKMLFNTRVAEIAGLLLAVSAFSIYYAQEVRMYSFLAFTSVLSVYFLLKYLDKQTPWSLINYVWSSTLLVYTHLYGLFVLFAENLYILSVISFYSEKSAGVELKKWVSAQILILLLALPWLVWLASRVLIVTEHGFWVKTPELNSILKTFATFSGTTRGLPVWGFALVLGMFSALIVKTAFGKKVLGEQSKLGEGRAVLLLSLLLLIPVLLPYLVSQYITPIYIIRCTIAGHFAFCLLVAVGIARIKSRPVRYVILAMVLMLSVKAIASEGYVHGSAAQIRQAVDYIEGNIGEQDVVVVCGDSHLEKPFRYYAEQHKNSISIFYLRELEDEVEFPEYQEVNQIWFVRRTDRVEWCGNLPQAISHQYVQTNMTDKTFKKLELITFNKI